MLLHRIQTNKWCHIRKCYPLTLRPTFITSLLKLNMPSMKPTTVIITFEVFSNSHMLLLTALATIKSKIYVNKKPVVAAKFQVKLKIILEYSSYCTLLMKSIRIACKKPSGLPSLPKMSILSLLYNWSSSLKLFIEVLKTWPGRNLLCWS